jgi:hypothetical protein
MYAKRKETIERVFADVKEKHGMRWTTLRGLKKLSMQVMLTFAAINLKNMANWTRQGPKMVITECAKIQREFQKGFRIF